MDKHTKKLLEECSLGCKMAIHSMEQVQEYIEEDALQKVIDDYKVKHEELEQKSTELLNEAGNEEKEPGAAASAFSWVSTEMKLMMKDSSRQIAKIMMDGCNMGIQSISEELNKNKDGAQEAKKVARKLIQVEETFLKDLEAFL